MIKPFLALAVILALSGLLPGQNITATLTGWVRDSTEQSVPAAEVKLLSLTTGAVLTMTTAQDGAFVFSGLLPGLYTLTVAKSGFQRLERTSLTLSAGERRSVSDLVLEVGTVSESVTVQASGAAVQTVSAERSGLISSSQVVELMLIGRDYLDLMKTLPGVADLGSHEAPGQFNFNMSIQGNRPGSNNATLDGSTNLNTGGQTGTWLSPSVDSIAEVKVLLNNYQAEYGRNAGASVNVITKSGTQDFHGAGYYFKRNEFFNANGFFFNQRGLKRPLYRYEFGGFNIGGPVYIPGKFNSNRDKLFFFFAQEFMPQSFPNTQNLITLPTALERRGDFSQTLDQNRRLIIIRDPETGAPFPNNIIPAPRVDPNMQKLLSVFPQPNYSDPSGAYNYVTSDTYKQPRYETLFRVDYRISPNHNLYVRGVGDWQTQTAGYGVPAQGGNWPLIPSSFRVPTKGILASLQQTFTPTFIHEFTFGATRGVEQMEPEDQAAVERISRRGLGMTLSQFYPQINDMDFIPNATFGGIPNAANIMFESRYPFFGANNLFDFIDNVTKIQGAHTLKAGIFIERVRRAAKRGAVFNGSFDFSRDVNNPLDTGWAYANALAGVFRSYSESNTRPWANARFSNVEWYVQDTWKVTRKLSLDYGIRFSIIYPQYERDGKSAGFTPDRYDPAKAAILVRPALDDSGRRMGFDPVTNAFVPALLIGSIAQGDPANGMVANSLDPSYPRGLQENRGVHYGPRFGFAYDPFGHGKTAIRGGFGITYDRVNGFIVGLTENPPLQYTPTSFFGRVSDFLNAGRVVFPSSVSGISRSGEVPTVMTFSLGIQREIGWGTVVDLAYAGSLGRHLLQSVNLNGVPLGANFLAANQDPAAPGRPLPPDFLRPFPGLGNINYFTYDASSNYNSMQLQVHRRFTRGLQFGSAWTWSKTMSTSDGGQVSRYLNQKTRYYGRVAFDRTHIVNINWIYDMPRLSAYWKSGFARWVLDNWQLTGIASFISGAPLAVGFTTTDAADITGSPTEVPRPDLVAKPELSKGERRVNRFFNTSAFARPAAGSIGNAAKDVLRGPGINNWDLGLYKNVQLREQMRFQLRWEVYNAFNHTQFDGLDTTARFDPAGRQVNARFGEIISARNPRRMQLALKFIF